jgi:hypothetical protein
MQYFLISGFDCIGTDAGAQGRKQPGTLSRVDCLQSAIEHIAR